MEIRRTRRWLLTRERALAGLVLAVVVGLAGTAAAVPASGTIVVPRASNAEPSAAGGPATYYWRVWNGLLDPVQPRIDPRRELAVVLTGPGAAVGCRYAIQGGDLLPKTMVVAAGSTVRIENRDAFAHELVSGDLADFPAVVTAPGNARTFTAPAGGPYHVVDHLYPHVRGTVHVVPSLTACATIDASGAYRFADVAAGAYRLEVYRGDVRVATQTVEVPPYRELVVPPITLSPGG